MNKFIVAVVAALALSIGVNSVAQAGKVEYRRMYCEEKKEYCQFKKVITYKTVIDYKIETVHITKWVTEYDDCGKPYKVKKTFCKEIEVPCKKVVAVVKWVKVCD